MTSRPAEPTTSSTISFLFPLGAAIALSYLAAPLFDLPFPLTPIWKATGIVLLGVYALVRGAHLTAAGLFFSAVGDVMLALEPPQWIGGMAAFGLAHVFYLAAFTQHFRRDNPSRAGLCSAALVVGLSLAMLVWFWPDMGALRTPGIFYQAIITTMVVVALLSSAPVPARLGAVIFMVSDTLIALGLYKDLPPIPGAIWITYAGAQALLAATLSKPRAEYR